MIPETPRDSEGFVGDCNILSALAVAFAIAVIAALLKTLGSLFS